MGFIQALEGKNCRPIRLFEIHARQSIERSWIVITGDRQAGESLAKNNQSLYLKQSVSLFD
jgi:hypothetical protein